MRKTLLGLAIMFCMVLGSFLLASNSKVSSNNGSQKQKPIRTQNTANDAAQKALFDNDKTFDQLSGAARSLLESKFGKKEDQKDKLGAAPINGDLALTGSDVNAANKLSPAINPLSGNSLVNSSGPRGSIKPLVQLTNVLANDPTLDLTAQDTQSESALVIANNGNVVSSFNDSGSFDGINSHFTGISVSTNGGTSFTDLRTLPDDNSGGGDAGDPVLAVNRSTGTVYLATLSFNDSALPVFRSTDNGLTYGQPVNSVPGLQGTGDFLDKEWIAVDNFSGTGQGNTYVVTRNFAASVARDGITFARSTDGGNTWGPNQGLLIAAGGQGSFVTVGPDHSVYVFWYNSSTTPRRITLRKSTDLGVTFGPTITVANMVGTGINGDLALTGGFRSDSFPQVVIHPTNGNLYAVFNDPSAATGGDRGNIFLTTSTNGGTTWSTPTRINDDTSTTAQQFFPTLAISPDGSRLFVGWYDRRRDPSNNMIDIYGAIATINGATTTFGPNFRITNQPFGVVIGQDPVINTTYMGDYDQAAADSNFFYMTWGDNRDRNNANTRFQQNVRIAKIPLAGPGAVLDFNGATIASDGNSNGVIDFNECTFLNVSLTNSGTAAATGVMATLTTTTPGVTVAQGMSAYPDIAAGTSAMNMTPFQITTSPDFVCGTKISLMLTVTTTADGTFTFPFSVNSGSVGTTTQSFESANVPIAINDVATVTSVTNVSGFTGSLAKVTVSFFLTHTFDADLDIFLVGPDGTTVELTTDNGGAGDNFGTSCAARTVFDDAAATSITAGTAPFAGTFRPEGMLASFSGKTGTAVNGTWTLRITDDLGGDVGTLMCWGLQLTPFVCMDGGGPCAGGNVCPVDHATIYGADAGNNRIQRSTDDGLSWQSLGFGTGAGVGQFRNPRGVAADSTDTFVFVADTGFVGQAGNSRIQRSTDGGLSWQVIMPAGTVLGTVKNPQGVAYDEINDILYVADTGNNRIQMVTAASTASPISSIFAGATAGTVVGKVNAPKGLSVNCMGQVYVADTNNNRIQMNMDGTPAGWVIFAGATAGGLGSPAGKVNQPAGVSVDSMGRVYVADTNNNRIQVNMDGTAGGWSLFMTAGTLPGFVNRPEGVVMAASGNVFVGDTGNNRVQKKGIAPGSLATVAGAPGTGPNQFNQPSSIR